MCNDKWHQRKPNQVRCKLQGEQGQCPSQQTERKVQCPDNDSGLYQRRVTTWHNNNLRNRWCVLTSTRVTELFDYGELSVTGERSRKCRWGQKTVLYFRTNTQWQQLVNGLFRRPRLNQGILIFCLRMQGPELWVTGLCRRPHRHKRC